MLLLVDISAALVDKGFPEQNDTKKNGVFINSYSVLHFRIMFSIKTLLLILGFACHANSSFAFVPFSKSMEMEKVMGSCFVLYSTEGETPEGAMSSEGAMSAIPGEQLPTPTSPPPVPQKRLDPLMASLTRMDPGAADVPTKNLPLLGEVPVDGSLTLLVPAAVIAVLGFLLSIVVAFQSQDLIVQSLVQASEDIAQTASMKTNMVYDDNVCRGLCSSQEQDLDNLRNFMESLRK